MQTVLRVLSDDERSQVHERTLEVLSKTGLRVDSVRARKILADAGADVDETSRIVRYPKDLVERCLSSAPRKFNLGGRRPHWTLPLSKGECTLVADGEGMQVVDGTPLQRRAATPDDWLKATRLIDALDEVGVYWRMVTSGLAGQSSGDLVAYWRKVFGNFSKHIQEGNEDPDQVHWTLEVLQVVFGDRATIKRLRPVSFLLCPLSPLILQGAPVDAYLETLDWGIPLAIMPMPLMGATAPASLISTLVLANTEALAVLCLAQTADPGTPCIYAPVPGLVNPRTGRYNGGEVEHALLGAAVAEMGGHYGLPVETATGGTDQPIPGLQAAYERAINWTLPVLAWPDILVGPGMLSGSTVLSYEQMVIDVEIFRRCRRLRQGINTEPKRWLEDVLAAVGAGGNFLAQRTTRDALRKNEWYISRLGFHDTYEQWEALDRPYILAEARERVDQFLANRESLPLDDRAERELDRIERQARMA